MKVYCKMVEFKKGKLGRITTSISRGITPSYTNNEGIYVVNQKCIRNGKISFDEIRISKEKLLSKEKIIEKTDTLICSTGVGTLGRVGRFNDFPENKIITADSHVTIVKADKKIVCPFYLSYVLISKQADIEGLAKGSTGQTELSKNELALLEIPLPPLDVQKRIAGILGALDDRIDVLRRENVVLEQMAQAVFQSWFVDFDIVRAKAAGTPEFEVCEKYHITPELYALFPSALTPDNLPLGWEKKAVKDVLTLNYGKALKETDRISGNIPVYGANGQIGTHNKSLVSGPGIVVGRKGTVGTVIWTDYDFYPIDTSFYVTSLFQEQPLHFLHQMLCSVNLPSLSGDSAVPGLNREAAYNQIFICPQEEILKNFENAVTIFYQKRKTNAEQIHALSATRDALLPKLMNGEIEV